MMIGRRAVLRGNSKDGLDALAWGATKFGLSINAINCSRPSRSSFLSHETPKTKWWEAAEEEENKNDDVGESDTTP